MILGEREYVTPDEQLRMVALEHAMKMGHVHAEAILKSAREFEAFLSGSTEPDPKAEVA